MLLTELVIRHCELRAGLFSNVALVVAVMRRLAEAFDSSEVKGDRINLVEYVDKMENSFPLFSVAFDLYSADFLDKLRGEIPTYKDLAKKMEAKFYAKRLEDDNWTDLDESTPRRCCNGGETSAEATFLHGRLLRVPCSPCLRAAQPLSASFPSSLAPWARAMTMPDSTSSKLA